MRRLGRIVTVALYLLVPAAACDRGSDSTTPAGPGDEAVASIEEGLAKREYEATRNDRGLQAPNRAQNLRTYFEPTGIRVHDRTAEGSPELLSMRLASLGRGETGEAVAAGEVISEGSRVEIRRPGLVEWYENGSSGLEQGFTLEVRPNGPGELWLELALDGATPRARQDGLELRSATGRRLRYSELHVRDAGGRALEARMQLASDSRVRLVVADVGATYPITIDPLLSGTADTQLESDQTSAALGFSVASAGDVNGDGYADVIVGAYQYDAGQLDEGAAFIFMGNASGLVDGSPGNAAAQLESDQQGGTLGFSVAGAGDVNGDGYADVIVGASGYTAGQSWEGAAFVFLGSASGIADGNPTTAAAQLESDQADADMGSSVAGAGDVNGDGYADVIVGARLFDAGEFNEGAAFVFLGSASGIADGNSATAAAQLESDQEGAWLGQSVAGAGDVNGDGYADVIVGAYQFDAGQTNEGAAFVFLGSASGIADGNPATAAAQLESNQSGSELGVGVGGLGDVNGDGYADAIVGAPLYDADQADEGAAFVFLGSASGIADGNPATAAAQLESNQANARLGRSVSGVGDINGDGYADAIVGAPLYDADQADEGAAFVFLGSASGIADGNPTTAAAQLESDQAGASLGQSVADAGDVNGDGYADVIVGAFRYDVGQTDEGAAFVFLGGGLGIAEGTPATANAQLESGQNGAGLDSSVAGAGDVNGDGYDDVIVGAPFYDAGEIHEGAAFVFLGSATGLANGTPVSAAAQLESNQASAFLGSSVAGAGDVNGDGYADVIVGAWGYGATQGGAAFVFLGSATGIADGTPASAAARLESDQAVAHLGYSAAGAGDVNGDGYADVIVGSPYYDSGQADEGAAFVFLGRATGIASGTTASAAARFESDQGGAQLGYSVAGAGDVNGDGYADVIVGAPHYITCGNSCGPGEGDQGAAYVLLGSAGGINGGTPASPGITRLEGLMWAMQGSSVAGAGDVNGDGYADVIVGAPVFDPVDREGKGAAFVFHGSAEGTIAYAPAYFLESDQDWSELGASVSGAGDVNGDGYADVIVGAPRYSVGQLTEGAAFVLLGSATGISAPSGIPPTAAARLESDQVNAELGRSVAGVGDVNGDGYADVIIGAPNYDAGETDEGAAFVFLGNGGVLGRPVLSRQLRPAPDDGFIQPFGSAGDTDSFRARLRATQPAGRGRVKLQVEACRNGTAFGSPACINVTSTDWADTGATAAGVDLTVAVPGLAPSTLYRWRGRVLYAPASVSAAGIVAPPKPAHGLWRRLGAQSVEGDVRTSSDNDLDGVADEADNCLLVVNPGQQDVDSDGFGDACDNCPLVINPLQTNTDGDSLGNDCDPDDDNDGLTDVEESALGTNPLLFDTDVDGLGDGAEVAAGTSPFDPDSDDDGALDGPDNCKRLANAAQTNGDTDAFGDVCDNCPRTTNPTQADAGGIGGATPDGVGSDCQNGDFNSDGVVDLLDTVLLRRRLVGLEPQLDPRMPPAP